mmetsp:Transcript_129748/g.361448  ORF Transcript_129748/g.361448 Transcript_129748/m.361448 type:complete len:275 (+) Transcript_129748:132-956(+)
MVGVADAALDAPALSQGHEDPRADLLDARVGGVDHGPLGVSPVELLAPIQFLTDVGQQRVRCLCTHLQRLHAGVADVCELLGVDVKGKHAILGKVPQLLRDLFVWHQRVVGNLVTTLRHEKGERSLATTRGPQDHDIGLPPALRLHAIVQRPRVLDALDQLHVPLVHELPPARDAQPAGIEVTLQLLKEGRPEVVPLHVEPFAALHHPGIRNGVNQGVNDESLPVLRLLDDVLDHAHVGEAKCRDVSRARTFKTMFKLSQRAENRSFRRFAGAI